MRARSEPLGIAERPVRYREWEAILKSSGFGAPNLQPVPGRRLRSPRLRRLGNAVRSIYVAIRLTR